MIDREINRIADWIVAHGLAGASETELLDGFCAELGRAGLQLDRALVLVDTLHPTFEGRAFRWRSDGRKEERVVEYGRSTEGEAAASWQSSIFHHMQQSGIGEQRRRIGEGDIAGYTHLATLRDEGHSDYVAFVQRFAADRVIGEMDCIYSNWSTKRPGGFGAAEMTALRRLVPALALAIKSASLARIAGTLADVYLGRDAGRRVLAGRISRGVADRIDAVLWYSDLRDFTTISDTAAPDELIPLLNDYAGAAIAAIHEAGGDVLKLVGDGTLAVFHADDPAEACRRALAAAAGFKARILALNARRAAEGRPVTSAYLGLHIGEVLYGNIGSDDRLDFTVVGPAVNEVARIAAMCRSVERKFLVSAEFAAAAPAAERASLVSVGRFALRGVARAQELFTRDPAAAGAAIAAATAEMQFEFDALAASADAPGASRYTH